jgi:hypothetical protein
MRYRKLCFFLFVSLFADVRPAVKVKIVFACVEPNAENKKKAGNNRNKNYERP